MTIVVGDADGRLTIIHLQLSDQEFLKLINFRLLVTRYSHRVLLEMLSHLKNNGGHFPNVIMKDFKCTESHFEHF